MRRPIRIRQAAARAATVGLVIAGPVPAQAKAVSPEIVRHQALYRGLTYGQWQARWGQWAFSIPADQNPLFDETGAGASVGQSGPVWFLVGVFNDSGTASRVIQIPSGKALFFPILNTECSTLEMAEMAAPFRVYLI